MFRAKWRINKHKPNFFWKQGLNKVVLYDKKIFLCLKCYLIYVFLYFFVDLQLLLDEGVRLVISTALQPSIKLISLSNSSLTKWLSHFASLTIISFHFKMGVNLACVHIIATNRYYVFEMRKKGRSVPILNKHDRLVAIHWLMSNTARHLKR